MHRRSRILFVLILASATPLFAFDGLTFHSVPPCVAFDTRPAFGGTGAFAAEEARVFYIVGTTAPFTAQGGTAGGCGVPPFSGDEPVARAIFINYVAIDPTGAGSVKAWATDQAEPVQGAMVNYQALTPPLNNSNAVVTELRQAAQGNDITVKARSAAVHVRGIILGYFTADSHAATAALSTTVVGEDAFNHTSTACCNTAIGFSALNANTSGAEGTAIGANALSKNTSSQANTAVGSGALKNTTTGLGGNVAVGQNSLLNNADGTDNTALGRAALPANINGDGNTAVGRSALFNSTGNGNTAVGLSALFTTTGANNIGVGAGAGGTPNLGSDNIHIGNAGLLADDNVIRIGASQTETYIAGINTASVGPAATVLVDANGQLGVPVSSGRFKEQIEDMGGTSRGLMDLRPVTFRYRNQAQSGTRFGLIAEEVEEVLPELVLRDSEGRALTVLYHELPALLINELQRQERELETLRTNLEELRQELTGMKEKGE
jgi:hypothetical protein